MEAESVARNVAKSKSLPGPKHRSRPKRPVRGAGGPQTAGPRRTRQDRGWRNGLLRRRVAIARRGCFRGRRRVPLSSAPLTPAAAATVAVELGAAAQHLLERRHAPYCRRCTGARRTLCSWSQQGWSAGLAKSLSEKQRLRQHSRPNCRQT